MNESELLVSDDEDEQTITAGDVVTLTVHLIRENMSNIFNKESTNNLSTSGNYDDEEATEENPDDKENRNKVIDRFRIERENLDFVFLLESRKRQSSSKRLDE